MKKILLGLVLFFFVGMPVSAKTVKLYFFHGEECPHCAEEKEFLNELQNEYQNLEIISYETWHSDENSILMDQVKISLNKQNPYVPFTVIGKNSETGFNTNTKTKIKEYIDYCIENECIDVVEKVIENGNAITLEDDKEFIEEETKFEVPILGKISAKDVSLPLLAIVVGFVDGFNPCAMWVLLFLISFLITTNNRKKMWILGLTFLLTSAFVYLLFMLSWLTITIKLSSVSIIRIIIALIALIAGIWNLRSFYRMSTKSVGCEVVNNTKRKKIIEKIKYYVLEKNMWIAIIGIIALAISVNFIELACSAGLPLLFTQVLSMNDLSNTMYFIYILLYVFFFLIDDLIIFLIAMFTLKVTGISNKYTKYSHLIGGLLMFIIGLLLIIKPEWIMLKL